MFVMHFLWTRFKLQKYEAKATNTDPELRGGKLRLTVKNCPLHIDSVRSAIFRSSVPCEQNENYSVSSVKFL